MEISNVVEAPYFDLKKEETVENWETNKHSPGLWGEIAGNRIIFTCPSGYLRNIKDVKGLVEFWDSVVETHQ